MKSLRKRVATQEYATHVRNEYLRFGGRSLQHTTGKTSLAHYVGSTTLEIPTHLKPGTSLRVPQTKSLKVTMRKRDDKKSYKAQKR